MAHFPQGPKYRPSNMSYDRCNVVSDIFIFSIIDSNNYMCISIPGRKQTTLLLYDGHFPREIDTEFYTWALR